MPHSTAHRRIAACESAIRGALEAYFRRLVERVELAYAVAAGEYGDYPPRAMTAAEAGAVMEPAGGAVAFLAMMERASETMELPAAYYGCATVAARQLEERGEGAPVPGAWP